MVLAVSSPFSAVYSPSLLGALGKVFDAKVPVSVVEEAAAAITNAKAAMSAAISEVDLSWKLHANIAPFVILLPHDVTTQAIWCQCLIGLFLTDWL